MYVIWINRIHIMPECLQIKNISMNGVHMHLILSYGVKILMPVGLQARCHFRVFMPTFWLS